MKKIVSILLLIVASFAFISCKKEHQHTFSELVKEVPATCEADGVKAHYTCKECDVLFDENKNEISDLKIPALGHEYLHHDATEATVDKDGNIEYYSCTRCDKVFIKDGGNFNEVEKSKVIISKHNLGALIPEVPATCETDGVKAHYECSDCDKIFDKDKKEITDLVIPKLGHDYVHHDAVEETVDKDGNIEYYSCSRCDKVFIKNGDNYQEIKREDVIISKHNLGALIPEVPAACEADGVKAHYECSDCGKLFDENKNEITDLVIPKLGHDYVHHDAVEPTMDNPGNIEYYSCSRCDKLFVKNGDAYEEKSRDEVFLSAHNCGELIKEVPATCEADGVKAHYVCSDCGKFFDENKREITDLVIPKLGHDYIHHDAVEATIENDGNIEYYSCSRCNKLFVKNGEAYTEIEASSIVISKLVATKIEEKDANLIETGNIEYYLVTGEVNRYFVLEDGKYKEVTLESVTIPRVKVVEVTLASTSLAFDLNRYDQESILSEILFNVKGDDDTIYVINANTIENFSTTPGKARTFNFKSVHDDLTVFEKEVTLDLFYGSFELAEPGTKFKNGDQILLVNINARAMANFLSYAGYTAGSSGTVKINVSDEIGNGLYRHADITGVDGVLVLTLLDSLSIDDTFYVRTPDGLNLCGGMGYTQWLEYSPNTSLAQSFEIIVRDDYSAVVHGQQYNYSYLRIWNRYGQDLDAFFVTTTADYGDNFYVYVLKKDYTGCAHEFGELVPYSAPSCEESGIAAHYECAQCGGYFDENKQKLDTIIIPALGHDYVHYDLVPATPESAGTKEHYKCSRCNEYFYLVEGKYVKTTEEDLVIPKIEAVFVEEVLPDFEFDGVMAHYRFEYEGVVTYSIKVGDEFIVKEYSDLILPKKQYTSGSITLNNESVTAFDIAGLTKEKVLSSIIFDIEASDGTIVHVNPTDVLEFNDEKIGKDLPYTFIYEAGSTQIVNQVINLDVYELAYQLVIDPSTLHDGDVVVLGNVNTRIMANYLSYVGYAAGSSASTKVTGANYLTDYGVNEFLYVTGNTEALLLTLKASKEASGAFYLVTPNDMLLCGGMGYTQWLPYSEANGLAESFTITIDDNCIATIHGNRYNYSYLRIWNRYGQDLDAFFITNSATYGDNIYLYKQFKSYEQINILENLVKVDRVEPTCTEDGHIEYYYCARNGKKYDSEGNRLNNVVLEMVSHSLSNLHEYLAPGCDTEGHIAYYECTNCHQLFDENCNEVDSVVIPATGHEYSSLNSEVDPTCTKSGNVEYCECIHCHKYFDANHNELDAIIIPALDHSYGELISGHPATCTEFGMVDHYVCSRCGLIFDTNHNHITNAYIDMHTYGGDGKCSVCGHEKPLSVAETKLITDKSLTVTVRGVVIGCTGNYDGGYVWVLIKDLLTNDVAAIRKQVVNDGMDGEERLVARGYSYAPAMYFHIGDVIEIPVGVLENSATKGGEAKKTILAYRGVSFTSDNAKSLVDLYKVGEVTDYRMNLDLVTEVIDSQEKLEAFVLSPKNQYKLVCIKGTKENPLKIVTHSATTAGVGDISREYLYLYYDEAKSLTDVRVNGAAPVFSNFGNQFNLKSMLSSILFGQSDYEDYAWENPNLFVGEIYCMIIGGSTAYYHFVVMNQGDIVNESFNGPIPIMPKTARDAFYDYQEENLRNMNVEIGRDINSAVGVTGVVCCEDMVKFGVLATQNEILSNIWSQETYSTTYINASGKETRITVNHAVLELEQCKKWIKPNYTIIGSKSGWLNYTSETRPYYVCNCLVAVEGPDNTVMVGYVYNKRGDNGDDSVYYYLSILYQILLNIHDGKPIDELEALLNCDSCAGVIIPKDGSVADNADLFSDSSSYIHYKKNSKELITTASTWKTFTGLTCCRYFTDDELDMKIEVIASDLNSIDSTPSFSGGETITLRDALHFMMLPSSNICPAIIARVIGTELIRAQMN